MSRFSLARRFWNHVITCKRVPDFSFVVRREGGTGKGEQLGGVGGEFTKSRAGSPKPRSKMVAKIELKYKAQLGQGECYNRKM